MYFVPLVRKMKQFYRPNFPIVQGMCFSIWWRHCNVVIELICSIIILLIGSRQGHLHHQILRVHVGAFLD